MAIQPLTPLPNPPLTTDSEAVFNAKTDATLLAEQKLVNVELNEKLIPGINAAVEQVEAAKTAAAESAKTATEQAAIATGSGDAAAAEVAKAAAEVKKAAAEVDKAAVQANNAKASATAAESAQGSIGNLALLHAITLATM
ncbi:TPA: hypothetical protein QEM72_005396 [Pseudomonas putida]|uniref:hypothetical protein n=1 Tax=Pseudomonas putida TaxID=303 RepID=UPI00236367C7|nr:hypothetical protein [Pseudomonas putida]MDD2077479.1 hypothetical protein [Pseudomonas putida]HDS1694763.1 hypothetical protein [Pseudomonas putida]